MEVNTQTQKNLVSPFWCAANSIWVLAFQQKNLTKQGLTVQQHRGIGPFEQYSIGQSMPTSNGQQRGSREEFWAQCRTVRLVCSMVSNGQFFSGHLRKALNPSTTSSMVNIRLSECTSSQWLYCLGRLFIPPCLASLRVLVCAKDIEVLRHFTKCSNHHNFLGEDQMISVGAFRSAQASQTRLIMLALGFPQCFVSFVYRKKLCLCAPLLYTGGACSLVGLHQLHLWCDRHRISEGTRPVVIWSEA